jgi:hypothetical protein
MQSFWNDDIESNIADMIRARPRYAPGVPLEVLVFPWPFYDSSVSDISVSLRRAGERSWQRFEFQENEEAPATLGRAPAATCSLFLEAQVHVGGTFLWEGPVDLPVTIEWGAAAATPDFDPAITAWLQTALRPALAGGNLECDALVSCYRPFPDLTLGLSLELLRGPNPIARAEVLVHATGGYGPFDDGRRQIPLNWLVPESSRSPRPLTLHITGNPALAARDIACPETSSRTEIRYWPGTLTIPLDPPSTQDDSSPPRGERL